MENSYRPDIDGLRALAILPVIAFHLFPNAVPGGFIGVDVFFVISGFLITQIIKSQLEKNTFSITSFYTRRVKRLFPSLIVVFALFLLYGHFVLLNKEFQALAGSTFFGSLSLSNFYFYKQVNYFDVKAILKPFLHLWSLAVEEQFYLFYPCLLLVSFKNKFIRKNILFLVSILAIASFCSNMLIKTIPKAYFMPYSRFWEIMLGAVLAFLPSHTAQFIFKKISANVLAFLGFLMVLISIFVFSDKVPYPGVRALLPTFGAVFLIFVGANAFINRTILSHPLSVFIGKVSYPLYLIHWPLIAFVNIIDPAAFTWRTKIGIIVASVIGAISLYSFVEKPVRESKLLSTKMLVALMFCISITSLVLYKVPNQTYVDKQYKELASHVDQSIEDWDFPNKSYEHLKSTELPFYKIGSGKKTVLFIGDSNMQQYGPRIEHLISKHKDSKSAIFATLGGCLPIKNMFAECVMHWKEFMKAAIGLSKDPNVDTVVLGAAWIGYLSNESNWYLEKNDVKLFLNTPQNLDLAYNELAEMIENWIKENKKVYIILPMPSGPEYCPKTFFSRTFLGQWRMEVKDASKQTWCTYSEKVISKLKAVARKTGAEILDPADHLCKNNHCLTNLNGKPIYKDGGHLRPWYVKEHITIFDALMSDAKP